MTDVLGRRLVGRIELLVVVPAAGQGPEVVAEESSGSSSCSGEGEAFWASALSLRTRSSRFGSGSRRLTMGMVYSLSPARTREILALGV